MNRVGLDKWRAILGTGIAGGAVAALLGGIVLGGISLLGATSMRFALSGTLAMGAFGFLSVGGAAAMLAASAGRESLDDLSLVKTGVLGFLSGSLFPAATALISAGQIFPLQLGTLAWLSVFFGGMGASITAGLVSVAKHQSRLELGTAARTALPEAGDTSA